MPPDEAPEAVEAVDTITDSTIIEKLAALSTLEYEQRREAEAERLGCRKTVLDKLVEQAQVGSNSDDNSAIFPDPEPWPDAVDGAALLDALAGTFARHLVLPTGAANAVALWTLHAHAHDTAGISPILAVTSAAPECGKTTLLMVLGALVPRAVPASNITAAALFRAVEKWRPTILVDEADTFLRDSDELRGVINSGHNKAAAFVIRTTGDDHEPRRFRTWAPKAIALIGKLPPTLASRAIHIEMRRMGPGEHAEPVRGDRLGHLEPLIRQAARWAQDHDVALRNAEPTMPATLLGRRADNWRHLLAIADSAGGEWPARARSAAEALTAGRHEETAGIMLLEDIEAIFTSRNTDRLTSAELATALGAMETRPWPEWRHGKAITVRQIARLLEPFPVVPSTIRTPEGTAKGYRRDQFNDAFARYLLFHPSHRHKPQKSAENPPPRSVTRVNDVTDEKTRKPAVTMACDGVTDENPVRPEMGVSGHDQGTLPEPEASAWGRDI